MMPQQDMIDTVEAMGQPLTVESVNDALHVMGYVACLGLLRVQPAHHFFLQVPGHRHPLQ